jgi:uncharacterized protein YjbI with pentapeptide repeats
MKNAFLAAVAGIGFALVTLSSNDAAAGCADPAGPEVNWVRCYHDERDLSGVDLSRARFRDARFTRADLSSADLSGADGFRTKFVSARLVNTKFDGARLIDSDFTKADLTGASLVKADLRRAKLFRAILRDANLTGARLNGADLVNADLSGALWTDGKTRCAKGSIGQCHTTPRQGNDGSS